MSTNIEVRPNITWTLTINTYTWDAHANYDFTNQSTIVFAHNLNKYPAVTVIDSAGDECEWEVDYDSLDQVTVRFTASFTGKIICN